MFRLILGLIVSVLLFIFVLQNNTMVSVHFLFFEFQSSMALILLLTVILTLIAAFLVALPFIIKKKFVKKEVTKVPEETKV
jgi:lipopolysaccharide assembly protein A